MKQFQDYKKYRKSQIYYNGVLSIILFWIGNITISALFDNTFSIAAISWAIIGFISLFPIFIIPSLLIGKWIVYRIEKNKLYRSNQKDILQSLWITFYSYFIVCFILSFLIKNNFELDNLDLLIKFIVPFSLYACLISLIFAYFLPTKIFNTNENLSGSLKE